MYSDLAKQLSGSRLSLFTQKSTDELSLADQLTQERDAALRKAAEHKEQLDAVFRAFELTSRIAAMDSTAYYRSQIGRAAGPTDRIKGRSRGRDSIMTDGHHESGAKLDAMLVEWKFEQTPLANLVSSVHRLQSNLYHTHTEAETAIDQTQPLHEDVTRYRERNRKLEKAIKLLSKDNGVLRVELEKTQVELEKSKVENDKLVRTVAIHEDDRKAKELDEAESRMSAQVVEHEKILRDEMKLNEPKVPQEIAATGRRGKLVRTLGERQLGVLEALPFSIAVSTEDIDGAMLQSMATLGGTATLQLTPPSSKPNMDEKLKVPRPIISIEATKDDPKSAETPGKFTFIEVCKHMDKLNNVSPQSVLK